MDAVQRLVPNFNKTEWASIYDKVGARLHFGQLKRVFVVLSDEDRSSQPGFSGSDMTHLDLIKNPRRVFPDWGPGSSVSAWNPHLGDALEAVGII